MYQCMWDSLYDGVIASTASKPLKDLLYEFLIGTKAFRQALADSSSSSGLTVNAPEDMMLSMPIYAALQGAHWRRSEKYTTNIEFDGVSGHIKFDDTVKSLKIITILLWNLRMATLFLWNNNLHSAR